MLLLGIVFQQGIASASASFFDTGLLLTLGGKSSIWRPNTNADGNNNNGILKNRNNNHRNLVWEMFPTDECPQSIWDAFETVNFEVTGCLSQTWQWDEENLLTIQAFQGSGVRTNQFGSGPRTDVLTQFQAKYTPNQGICDTFDWCIGGDDLNVYAKYVYDCRNVYCGPHAARNCDGTYISTDCSDETATSPALPALASIECDKDRSLLTTEQLALCPLPCSDYQIPGSDVVGYTYECSPQTVACTADGTSCLVSWQSNFFIEIGRIVQLCFHFSDDYENNRPKQFCLSRSFVGEELINGNPYHAEIACEAAVTNDSGDDLECTCTPCAEPLAIGQAMLVNVQCTDGSSLDQCNSSGGTGPMTTTGVIASLLESPDMIPVDQDEEFEASTTSPPQNTNIMPMASTTSSGSVSQTATSIPSSSNIANDTPITSTVGGGNAALSNTNGDNGGSSSMAWRSMRTSTTALTCLGVFILTVPAVLL